MQPSPALLHAAPRGSSPAGRAVAMAACHACPRLLCRRAGHGSGDGLPSSPAQPQLALPKLPSPTSSSSLYSPMLLGCDMAGWPAWISWISCRWRCCEWRAAHCCSPPLGQTSQRYCPNKASNSQVVFNSL